MLSELAEVKLILTGTLLQINVPALVNYSAALVT